MPTTYEDIHATSVMKSRRTPKGQRRALDKFRKGAPIKEDDDTNKSKTDESE